LFCGIGELRHLREENGKLKRLVADLSLDRHILQPRRPKFLTSCGSALLGGLQTENLQL
jgi:hypothetical protein